jgi:predicted XRE-type DNA-binding protein
MARKRRVNLRVSESSGNVFADLGFPNPDEELAKAQLLMYIQQAIKRRRLSQPAAATLMGIDQQKVSALLGGRGANFTLGRLMRLLAKLGHDIHLTVRAKSGWRERGEIRVLFGVHL